MAEVVVGFVVGKLADIIEKEMEFLGGVGVKVKQVQRELIRIQCCLKDADSKRQVDARVQHWLNELRDVAYRIEDTTDTFFLEVEDHVEKDPSFLEKLKKLWCLCEKPQKVRILHKLGTELDDILSILVEISKSREHYGIQNLQDIVGVAVRMPNRRAAYHHVDETEVVGLQADRNNILQMLLDQETERRVVITIVGTGGLGKTTLAHLVYRSASAMFDYHIMLSVSQQFSLNDLFTKMLRRLKGSTPENLDEEHLILELRSGLKDKKYLIILDDVWQVDLWKELQVALPDGKNGSRILMTSRHFDVANSSGSKWPPYELDLLDDKASRELLLKKAFPYQEPGEDCPSDLLELADKLSHNCKRLPLALIVVGGILATKVLTYQAWERVLQMNWPFEGKDCMDVLAMSYEDMPYYLKPCFLYLASFPEDYEISAKSLTRMWIAEGLIKREGRKTMMETAQKNLEELFQRSMVQVSSRSIDGSIKCCKVHDLLRDLAMHRAEQENFVTIFSEASDVNQPTRGIRRASFQSCGPQSMEYIGSNTRTLLMFKYLPEWSNLRLLKVLYLAGIKNYDDKLIRGLEKLIHLRYLGIRNSEIYNSSCYLRPMKALETIDMRGTKIKLSNALWSIGTLRHIRCDGNSLDRPTLNGPISIANLPNLETLQWVPPPRICDEKLPLLNNLRKLGLCKLLSDDVSWDTVSNLLETLSSVVSLKIRGISLPMEIVYPRALPNYQNVQYLYLEGELPENTTLKASLFPPRLVKLKLVNFQLWQDPMPELGKLKCLNKLCFGPDVIIYWGPLACLAGFPVLQYLKVNDSCIQSLIVAEGVMPKLTYLQVSDNIKLHLPPQLKHLAYRQLWQREKDKHHGNK